MYILLTKREVKMAEYWPSFISAFLWTKTKSRCMHKNANRTRPNKLGQYFIMWHKEH